MAFGVVFCTVLRGHVFEMTTLSEAFYWGLGPKKIRMANLDCLVWLIDELMDSV